jgi:hypothetical protein
MSNSNNSHAYKIKILDGATTNLTYMLQVQNVISLLTQQRRKIRKHGSEALAKPSNQSIFAWLKALWHILDELLMLRKLGKS